jgi:hypothetical protein
MAAYTTFLLGKNLQSTTNHCFERATEIEPNDLICNQLPAPNVAQWIAKAERDLPSCERFSLGRQCAWTQLILTDAASASACFLGSSAREPSSSSTMWLSRCDRILMPGRPLPLVAQWISGRLSPNGKRLLIDLCRGDEPEYVLRKNLAGLNEIRIAQIVDRLHTLPSLARWRQGQ